ncbi:MAG: hypothetical protein H6740_26020 [Alphaproteobacteria bacterium]|nr:hypothetical protein [Alphaproteobacteria bacterium]
MIELPPNPTMQDYQRYIHELEDAQGWLEVDLVRSCFLMGEEVGELFKAVRKVERMFDEQAPAPREAAVAHVGEELVDVLNYLLAIANRLDIDVEAAFRDKNRLNQTRTWT